MLKLVGGLSVFNLLYAVHVREQDPALLSPWCGHSAVLALFWICVGSRLGLWGLDIVNPAGPLRTLGLDACQATKKGTYVNESGRYQLDNS